MILEVIITYLSYCRIYSSYDHLYETVGDAKSNIRYLTFSQKPTVFLFNDGDSLAEAEGYAADLAKLLQVTLNFSAVLVPNTGFGAYNNGTWNGMVGDLYRGVRNMYFLLQAPNHTVD